MRDYWEAHFYGFTVHHHDLLGRTTHGICDVELNLVGTIWQGADWAAGLLGLCPRRTALTRVSLALWLPTSTVPTKHDHDQASAELVRLTMQREHWLLSHHHMQDRSLPLILAPGLNGLKEAWDGATGSPCRLLVVEAQHSAMPATVANSFRKLSGDLPANWLPVCEAARLYWRHRDRMEQENILDRFSLLPDDKRIQATFKGR